MTGEQTTLILGLAVFGMMVLLLSRAKPKKTAHASDPHPHPKGGVHKGIKRRR
jgi:hypothetical protein